MKRKPKKYLSDSEQQEILHMYFGNFNLTIPEIASKYKISSGVISRLISKKLKHRFETVKKIKDL